MVQWCWEWCFGKPELKYQWLPMSSCHFIYPTEADGTINSNPLLAMDSEALLKELDSLRSFETLVNDSTLEQHFRTQKSLEIDGFIRAFCSAKKHAEQLYKTRMYYIAYRFGNGLTETSNIRNRMWLDLRNGEIEGVHYIVKSLKNDILRSTVGIFGDAESPRVHLVVVALQMLNENLREVPSPYPGVFDMEELAQHEEINELVGRAGIEKIQELTLRPFQMKESVLENWYGGPAGVAEAKHQRRLAETSLKCEIYCKKYLTK